MNVPTPPIGPSTIAGLTTILVGLVGAALSLCGVVVDDETTRQIGVIVGGLVALAALGWTTWSRTRQAQTLASALRSSWGITAASGAGTFTTLPGPMGTRPGEFDRDPQAPHPDELRDLHDGDRT